MKVPPRRSSTPNCAARARWAMAARARASCGDRQPIGIADHGHDQPARRIHGHAQVHVFLVDDLLVGVVEAGVERRVRAQGKGHGLHHEGHER